MKTILLFTFLFTLNSFAKDGRYEFHMNQQYPARSVMIDTQTGRIWRDTCFKQDDKGECIVGAWQEADIIGINVKYEDVKAVIKKYEKGE